MKSKESYLNNNKNNGLEEDFLCQKTKESNMNSRWDELIWKILDAAINGIPDEYADEHNEISTTSLEGFIFDIFVEAGMIESDGVNDITDMMDADGFQEAADKFIESFNFDIRAEIEEVSKQKQS